MSEKYITGVIKRPNEETERDHYLRRCVVLEDENDKLKKLLELHGIEYPNTDIDARPVLDWREIAGRGEKLCPIE